MKLNDYLKGVQNSNTALFVKSERIRIRARIICIEDDKVSVMFEGQDVVTGATFDKRECILSTVMSYLEFEKALLDEFKKAHKKEII